VTKLLLLISGILCFPAAQTVWDGVYTPEQAKRGQAVFLEKCASCHGQDLGGTQGSAVEVDGTPLVGASFIEKWREDELGELFKFIQTSMPHGSPAAASDSEKLDVLAFILRSNNFPAGASVLTAESVSRIMLVGKDGPEPLPNMTAVRVVGCLSLMPPNAWMVRQASTPVRSRNPEEMTTEETNASLSQTLGTFSFKLPKLEFAVPGFKPGDFKDHKVLVKGVLYLQPNNDHINVTAIKPLADTCGGQ
jgi:hypothetical protein